MAIAAVVAAGGAYLLYLWNSKRAYPRRSLQRQPLRTAKEPVETLRQMWLAIQWTAETCAAKVQPYLKLVEVGCDAAEVPELLPVVSSGSGGVAALVSSPGTKPESRTW